MSASREKKNRQNQVPAEEIVVDTKKGMSKGLKTILGVIVAIALVALVVFCAMVNGGYFETKSTAAIVNGHKITPAMANYYYTNAYASMESSLSYLGVDAEKPLNEQECAFRTEGGTWADYFMDYAMNNAASVYSIYDEAVANGFTLSEEAQKAIESELSSVELMATMYGYSNADAILAAQYGRGCNVKSYEEFLTVSYIAQEYANSIISGFTYSQSDLDTYYAENAANFDGFTYRSFEVLAEAEGEGEEASVTEATLAAAEEIAKAMAEKAAGNEQAFIDLALENAAEDSKETYQNAAATLREDYTASSMGVAAEWITDASRVSGDTIYLPNGNETGFVVLYFVEAVDHSFMLPNVRHILIGVSDTTDVTAMEEAKAKAEALLDEFLAGSATEEDFAALAVENSTDATAENGGLYETVAPGVTVSAFDAWCFDESRQVGDTGVIETEYGYHVMYFSGLSDVSYQNYMVENAMLNADYSAWQAEVTADQTYEVTSMKYVETR